MPCTTALQLFPTHDISFDSLSILSLLDIGMVSFLPVTLYFNLNSLGKLGE